VIQRLPELALSQGLRSTSRVAKALTRIAVASSSCEAALLETAKKLLGEEGSTPACGLFIASELLCSGGRDACFEEATSLLEAGMSHHDEFMRCMAFELVDGIMGGSQTAASAAWTRQVCTQAASIAADALRGFPVSELGDETIPSMKVLPGAMRVVLVDARSDPAAHASLVYQCWHAVTGLHNCTSAHAKNNEGSFLTLKSLLEIMLDEAVRFPAAVQTCLRRGSEAGLRHWSDGAAPPPPPPDIHSCLLQLVEAHRHVTSNLDDTVAAAESGRSTPATLCRMTVSGCENLLDMAGRSSCFAAEHRVHIMDMTVCCFKGLSSASNYCFEEAVDGGIHNCAAYAVNRWAAATEPLVDSSTTCDAEVLCALSLFRECVAVTSAHGEVDTCHRLIVKATAEQARVAASQAVAKRANPPALTSGQYSAAWRAAKHSPICGAIAMFCNAFHRQVSRVDFDGAAHDIAVATLSVTHALIRMSGAEASGDAHFVDDASMTVLQVSLFSSRSFVAVPGCMRRFLCSSNTTVWHADDPNARRLFLRRS